MTQIWTCRTGGSSSFSSCFIFKDLMKFSIPCWSRRDSNWKYFLIYVIYRFYKNSEERTLNKFLRDFAKDVAFFCISFSRRETYGLSVPYFLKWSGRMTRKITIKSHHFRNKIHSFFHFVDKFLVVLFQERWLSFSSLSKRCRFSAVSILGKNHDRTFISILMTLYRLFIELSVPVTMRRRVLSSTE